MASQETGTGGQRPCRFGWTCRRADCWFYHPDGRGIDGAPDPALGAGGVAGATASFGAMGLGGGPLSTGLPPKQVDCRFGRKCNRKECYFKHPDGREIDDGFEVIGDDEKDDEMDEVVRAIEEEEEKKMEEMSKDDSSTFFPGSRNCTCCKGTRLKCACTDSGAQVCSHCGTGTNSSAAADGQVDNSISGWAPWKDEWFPSNRDCECCHGYKYRCEAADCRVSGVCAVCAKAGNAAADAAARNAASMSNK